MNELKTPLVDMLRSCVQCGLCLPHCATYLGTGNEVQSPRGRLLLLGEMLANESEPAPDSFLAAFDRCIGCRACETVCPSGVPFTLMEHGQQQAAHWRAGRVNAGPEPGVPGPVLRRLDSVAFLKILSRSGAVARRMCEVVVGKHWRQKLSKGPAPLAKMSRLLGSLPVSPASDADLVNLLDGLIGRPVSSVQLPEISGPGPLRPVLFFAGCANAALLPATSRRLLAVLRQAGFEVSLPTGQDCCGALAAHTGRPGRAAVLRSRNEEAFKTLPATNAIPIVVEAAGCGLELSSYGPDFRGRVVDAVALLARAGHEELDSVALNSVPLRSVPLTVAFHDPCHARHGQKITEAPRQLLAAIPDLTWLEATEKEVCCGSGGAWGLRYPELSADLGRRKAADLAATGADLVVTTNPGCLGQIADGLALEAPEIPIIPLTDLWWYARGCRTP